MTDKSFLLKRRPNDISGLCAGPVKRVEHELKPWAKLCHPLADALDFHKILSTEEALCSEIDNTSTYSERWIVAFANIFFEIGILTPEQLACKMDEVLSRWSPEATLEGGGSAHA